MSVLASWLLVLVVGECVVIVTLLIVAWNDWMDAR